MKTKALLLTACTLLATVQATAQKRAERLSLENPESFSMILMGDPQSYVKYDINQPVFELTTAWTADNIENLKIKAVLVTGDLVETNDNAVPVRSMANQTSRQMWESVSRSFERLDNKVPYIISPGNHDYGYRSAENGRTCFPEYFPVERNNKWNDALVALYPNRNGDQSLENAAFEFSDKNWGKLLVISSEFAPRDEVLEWAKNLCTSDKYKNHRVIFLTHSYLKGGAKAERIVSEGYKITPRNWGQAIWNKLIKVTPNIRCVICGHAAEPDSFEGHVSFREDKNDAGITVPQMMFNVQALGGGWEGNGGDGWLRILEFKPDGKTVSIKTYSPLFGISPTTKQFAHRTGKIDQFDMILEK